MLNIKTKNRLSVLIAVSSLSIVLVVFIFKTLEDNVLYFYSPSEIETSNKISYKSDIRIGGMVKDGSVQTNNNEIELLLNLPPPFKTKTGKFSIIYNRILLKGKY